MKRCKPISFYQQAELNTNNYWASYSSNAFPRLADHQPILRAYNKILSYQSHKMVMEIHKEEQPALFTELVPNREKGKGSKRVCADAQRKNRSTPKGSWPFYQRFCPSKDQCPTIRRLGRRLNTRW